MAQLAVQLTFKSVDVYVASTGALDSLEEEAGFQACTGGMLLPEPAKPGSAAS